MKKKLIVPIFLAAMALPVCLNKGAQGVNADWIGEYTKSADYLKYGVAINGQMADEGFVLLKNRKNDAGKAFLPMVGNEKISLVGKNSVKYKTSGSGSKDIARGGGGSGDASPSSGVTALDFEQSLKNAGSKSSPVKVVKVVTLKHVTLTTALRQTQVLNKSLTDTLFNYLQMKKPYSTN